MKDNDYDHKTNSKTRNVTYLHRAVAQRGQLPSNGVFTKLLPSNGRVYRVIT
jgi:hypothetical protein